MTKTMIVARGGEVFAEVLSEINNLPGSTIVDDQTYTITEIVSFQVDNGFAEDSTPTNPKPYFHIFALVRLKRYTLNDEIVSVGTMMQETGANVE